MTFTDYVKGAKSTAMYKSKEMQITCSVYGIFGEMYEYIEKTHIFGDSKDFSIDWKRELGDVCWYLALLSDAYGYSPKEIPGIMEAKSPMSSFLQDATFICKTLEIFKKLYRKHDYINIEMEDTNWISYIQKIYRFMDIIYSLCLIEAEWMETSIEEIWQINLDKLSDRKDRGVLHSSGDNR